MTINFPFDANAVVRLDSIPYGSVFSGKIPPHQEESFYLMVQGGVVNLRTYLYSCLSYTTPVQHFKLFAKSELNIK